MACTSIAKPSIASCLPSKPLGEGWIRRNDETKEQAHKLLVT